LLSLKFTIAKLRVGSAFAKSVKSKIERGRVECQNQENKKINLPPLARVTIRCRLKRFRKPKRQQYGGQFSTTNLEESI